MSQTTKTVLGLVALVLVAGAVGLYAYQGVYRADLRAEAKNDQATRLLPAPPPLVGEADGGSRVTEFTSLRITFEGQTTVLERTEGSWLITSPLKAKADRLAVDAITSLLQQSRFKSTIDEAPSADTLKTYGLDHPTFSVEAEATVDGQSKSLSLEAGIENTFDGSIFMRRNHEPAVYAAEGGVRYSMAKNTFDLREKQVLAVDEAKLTSLAIKTKNNDWQIDRVDGQWAFVRPFHELADPVQISSLVGSLANERAQKFPSDSEGFHFDKPLIDARLTFKSGATTHLRFVQRAADQPVQVLREDSDGLTTLAELKPSALQLDRNPVDLKDKAVIRFKKELATKIVLESNVGQVVLSKDSAAASVDGWKLTSPRAAKVKVFKVTALLWNLSSFKASAWGVEKPKDWAKFGLAAGARSIAVFGENNVELARLSIGSEVPGKPNTFYIRGTKDQVAESDGSRFPEFPWVATDLIDEPDAGP